MGSELHLDSKGNCFLCLKEITNAAAANGRVESVSSETFPSLYSLQDVTQYLDIDLANVFKDKDPVTHKRMANLENTRLKVPLCDECILLNQQFSTAFQQLEKINLEMIGCIKGIHDQIAGAVSSGEYDRFREIVASVADSGNDVMSGKLNIVNLLRIEAMRKSACCLYKSKRSGKIQMLKRKVNGNGPKPSLAVFIPEALQSSSEVPYIESVNELKKEEDDVTILGGTTIEKRDVKNSYPEPVVSSLTTMESEVSSSQQKWLEKLKGKGYITSPPTIITSEKQGKSTAGNQKEQSQPGPSRKMEDMPYEDDFFPLSPLNLKVEEDVVETILELNVPLIVENPTNGRYCCKICSRKFNSKAGLYCHNKTVHLNVRYKCEPCGKEYIGSASFRRHYNTVHLGVRHVCKGCGKTFTQKGHLKYHKQTSCTAENLQTNFRCDICGKMLAAANVLRRHIRTVHLKIKNQVCCICGMRFHLNCQLQQHIQKIHGVVQQQ